MDVTNGIFYCYQFVVSCACVILKLAAKLDVGY